MKTSYRSTCLLRVLIQWTEQFFSHKLVRPCGAVLADGCFCLSSCWLAFQFCWPLCCDTQSRSAAAILNPNRGKEQSLQTTLLPPTPILYRCNSLSCTGLPGASWDPTSWEVSPKACRHIVELEKKNNKVTYFLQGFASLLLFFFSPLPPPPTSHRIQTALCTATISFLLGFHGGYQAMTQGRVKGGLNRPGKACVLCWSGGIRVRGRPSKHTGVECNHI